MKAGIANAQPALRREALYCGYRREGRINTRHPFAHRRKDDDTLTRAD
jgi:hypothetical protein